MPGGGDIGIRYVAMTPGGQTLIPDGAWLASYDPEARDGFGVSEWTTDTAEAMRFESAEQAVELYRAVPKNHPVRRTDGKPNRPLTAFTVSFERIPEGE